MSRNDRHMEEFGQSTLKQNGIVVGLCDEKSRILLLFCFLLKKFPDRDIIKTAGV